jgi:hypothetical protein
MGVYLGGGRGHPTLNVPIIVAWAIDTQTNRIKKQVLEEQTQTH